MISPTTALAFLVVLVASYWLQGTTFSHWCIVVVVLTSPYWFWRIVKSIYFVSPISREAATLVISWSSVTWPKRLRRAFERSFSVPKFEASRSHPHPTLATERSSVMAGVQVFARAHGMEVYSYSAGPDEVGQRTSYYWASDLRTPPRIDSVKNPLRAFVFADFHYEELAVILSDPCPTVITTIVPSVPCGANSETAWTFTPDNWFEMSVRGGGQFRHKLWDYSVDLLSFYTPASWKQWRSRFTTYAVSVKRLSPLTVVVFLDPQSSVVGYAATLAATILDHNRLKRMKPVVGKVASLKSFEKIPTVSLGLVNTHLSVSLPIQTFDAFQSQARVSSHAISLTIVKSFAEKMGLDLRPQEMIVLVEVLREVPYLPQHIPFAAAVRVFSTEAEDASVTKVFVQSGPIIHGAFVPANNPSMSAAAVRHRLLQFQNDESWDPFTHEERGYVIEYCEYFASCIGKLSSVEAEEVVLKQRTAAKQLLLHNDMELGGIENVLKAFVKNEVYPKITDPRIITTYPQADKLEYAAFMLALGEAMKRHLPFYGFHNPLEIANKMALIFDGAEVATLGDASRMDGHITSRVRAAEWYLLRRLFHRSEWKPLRRAVNSACCRKAFMAHNSKDPWINLCYVLLFERGSGSMETSAMNTSLTAAMHFVAWRIAGRSLEETITHMNEDLVTAGDDSAAANLPAYALEAAGEIFGMDMKVDIVERGGFGVNFLNRWYTRGIWHGDQGSFTNVPRALSKYHVTTGQLTVEEWVLSRLTTYARSDRMTPILGDLVRALERVAQVNGFSFREGQALERPYLRSDDDYDWPQTAFCEVDFGDYVERYLSEFDFPSFKAWVREVIATGSLAAFINPPVCMEVTSTHPRYVELDSTGFPSDGAGPQFPLPAPPSAVEVKVARRNVWHEVHVLEDYERVSPPPDV